MPDPLYAHWLRRLEQVIDGANELGAAEMITSRLQVKYLHTRKEIYKLQVFLEGLTLLLDDEKFGPLREEATLYNQNATHQVEGIRD
jgi:hypothetical protein